MPVCFGKSLLGKYSSLVEVNRLLDICNGGVVSDRSFGVRVWWWSDFCSISTNLFGFTDAEDGS